MGEQKRTTPSTDIPKDFPDDETVFMLSLLQWNEQAKYPEESSHPPCSGEEACVGRFYKEFTRLAAEAGDFECVYHGLPVSRVHGSETWDFVALVKFSNIETFRNTIGSDDYSLPVLEHLDAALRNWKLVFFTSPKARCNEDVGYRPRKFCLTRNLPEVNGNKAFISL
ncbi:hypothetical protein BJX99DRAFT_219628 [Aspergillus californicus]